RQGEDVCAILHVGHRYTGQRPDDQMMPAELLTKGGQVAVIASPDKSGAKYGEIPAVPLGKASGDPLLPPFGNGVAVAGIYVLHPMNRRVLIEDPLCRTIIID